MLQVSVNCAVLDEKRPAAVPPDDVIQDIIDKYIDNFNLYALLPKRWWGSENVWPKKRIIKYDHHHEFDSGITDWLNSMSCFDSKQFEWSCCMKRWIDFIFGNLGKTDSFWIQSRDTVGRLSISPVVKFMMALKINDLVWCTFQCSHWLFLMGESTARWCLQKFCLGIVKCPELSEKCLHSPSRSDLHRIV